jgi:hypothetical protein
MRPNVAAALVAWLKTIRPANADPKPGIAAIREARDER